MNKNVNILNNNMSNHNIILNKFKNINIEILEKNNIKYTLNYIKTISKNNNSKNKLFQIIELCNNITQNYPKIINETISLPILNTDMNFIYNISNIIFNDYDKNLYWFIYQYIVNCIIQKKLNFYDIKNLYQNLDSNKLQFLLNSLRTQNNTYYNNLIDDTYNCWLPQKNKQNNCKWINSLSNKYKLCELQSYNDYIIICKSLDIIQKYNIKTILNKIIKNLFLLYDFILRKILIINDPFLNEKIITISQFNYLYQPQIIQTETEQSLKYQYYGGTTKKSYQKKISDS